MILPAVIVTKTVAAVPAHTYSNYLVPSMLRMLIVSPFYLLDELTYVLRPARQRLTTHDQYTTGSCSRALFFVVQPTLVDLKHDSLYFIQYIVVKVRSQGC